MNMQIEKEHRHMNRTMRITRVHGNRQTDKEWAGGRLRLLLVKRQVCGFTLLITSSA